MKEKLKNGDNKKKYKGEILKSRYFHFNSVYEKKIKNLKAFQRDWTSKKW